MTDWPANMPKPTWESKDGSVLLYHGDCLDILPQLPDGCVDAVVTDPPYGIGRLMRGGKNTGHWGALSSGNPWDMETPSLDCVLSLSGTAIVWGGNYFPLPPARCVLVWRKLNAVPTQAAAELAWTNLNRPVQMFSSPSGGAVERFGHPTEKPVELMLWCVEQCRPSPQVVCDPFMGSGTTGVACVRLSRRFIGIEIERKYFDIAVRRIEEAFDSQALFRQDEQREPDPELFNAANDSAKNVAVPESTLDSNERAKA